MRLKPSDLEQLTDERLHSLGEAEAKRLLGIALSDLREALDRLNQGPGNSSRPSGSLAPFERGGSAGEGEAPDADDEAQPGADGSDRADGDEPEGTDPLCAESPIDATPPPRKPPGRQAGMAGHSWQLTMPVTGEVDHRPTTCLVCASVLPAEGFVATGGHYVLDLERADTTLGLTVTHVKHRYGTLRCPCCGHVNDSTPPPLADDPLWQAGLSAWHRVGPHLASLIVFLHMRMHASYARMQEFLQEWLGIELSTATLNRTVQEMGRALEPVEEELVRDIQQAAQLHIDETGHLEAGKLLWLWVFITANTCLYQIGYRTAEFLDNLLTGIFEGWLMSDGYGAYRRFLKRLRCWAHLVRKAQGVAMSHELKVRSFGQTLLDQLEEMMAAIYAARIRPPPTPLPEHFAPALAKLRQLCERYRDSDHTKARALAREFLNDWEAIFAILADPARPLTNNLAERILRHWVIHRRITYGTRTEAGTRALGIIASVIDTCRLRHINPWPFLADALRARRNGAQSLTMPLAAA
jgi:hypothetical protein